MITFMLCKNVIMKNKEDTLTELERGVSLLIEEKFQLSDIGLTSKTAFDWSRSGIYLTERKSKYRRKYNGVEYVWLRMVKELRDFGLSINAIVSLRNFLLQPFDYKQLFSELTEMEEFKADSILHGLIKSEGNAIDIDEETKEHLNERLLNTTLFALLLINIYEGADTHLLINKEGSCFILEETPLHDKTISSAMVNAPYISFPLNYVLGEFIAREDLYDYNLFSESLNLNQKEQKVLDLLRQGNLSSLVVKFHDNEINLIETEEDLDLKEAKGRFVDVIHRGAYQEISYKTQNGKVVNIKRRTKHK